MGFRLANLTAIAMAAVAFVIVPGIYVLASKAATNLVTGYGTSKAAGRSNRVTQEAETMPVPAECASVYGKLGEGTRKAWARCKAAEARVVAAAKAVGGLPKQNGPEGPPASPADALRATRGVPPAR